MEPFFVVLCWGGWEGPEASGRPGGDLPEAKKPKGPSFCGALLSGPQVYDAPQQIARIAPKGGRPARLPAGRLLNPLCEATHHVTASKHRIGPRGGLG
jgi:hypothetical protein